MLEGGFNGTCREAVIGLFMSVTKEHELYIGTCRKAVIGLFMSVTKGHELYS